MKRASLLPPSTSMETLRARVSALIADGDATAAVAAIRHEWDAVAGTDPLELRALIETLPTDAWAAAPWLATVVGATFRAAPSPRSTAALAYFDEGLRSIDADSDPRAVAEALVHRAAARRVLGRLDDAVADLQSASDLVDDTIAPIPWRLGMLARISLQRGLALLHRGEFLRAGEQLMFARGLQDPYLPLADRVEIAGTLGILAYTESDFVAADTVLEQAESFAHDTGLMSTGYGTPARIARLLIAVDRNDLAAVRAVEDGALTLAHGTEWEPFALIVSARARALDGEYLLALELLRQSRRLYRQWVPAGSGAFLGDTLRAHVLVRIGQGDEAWKVLSTMASDRHHYVCPHRFVAQLRLSNGDLEGALAALQPCEEVGEAHAMRTLVDVQLLRAAIEIGLGDRSGAAYWADRGLRTMATTGIRTPLQLVPSGLLRELADDARERPQSAAVVALLEELSGSLEGDPTSPEPLTARETAVLSQLRRGLGIAAIATELFVSPNTVKTHLRSVYRKLGVSSRGAAVRKASSMGLYQDAITPESSIDGFRVDDER